MTSQYTRSGRKKQALTIKASDVEKVYNGETQSVSAEGYEWSGLKAGHKIINIKTIGSGRDVKDGGYPITFTDTAKL